MPKERSASARLRRLDSNHAGIAEEDETAFAKADAADDVAQVDGDDHEAQQAKQTSPPPPPHIHRCRPHRHSVTSKRVHVSRPIFSQAGFDARYHFTRPKAPSGFGGEARSVAERFGAAACHKPTGRCLLNCLLRLLPCVTIMRHYKLKKDLVADIIAGLTVGIMNIPQGMAYAMLADLPPVCGLYLGFYPLLLYFLFGTSRQVSMGTFAISSLMVAVPVTRLASQGTAPSPPSSTTLAALVGNETGDSINGTLITEAPDAAAYRTEVALSVSLLAGLIQLGLGLLRFGFITTYLSTPLVSGFTTGAAFHVLTSQVPSVLGIKVPRHSGFFKLALTYADVFKRIGGANAASMVISALCIGVLLLFRLFINPRLAKRCRFPVPVELTLVVAGALSSHFAQFQATYSVAVVGDIPSGLSAPRLPPVSLFPQVVQDAAQLAVIMYACTFSICKLYADRHGYPLDSNQELLACGLVNSVGACFGCYFSAGSLSRSQVQDDMGGRTQVTSLVAASLMLLVLLVLGPLFKPLPTAVLASIIIVALKGLFMQFADIRRLYRMSKYDLSIWLVCFLGVVIGNVSYGLVIGFAYSLLTVVCRTQSPGASILGRLPMTDIYKDTRFYPDALQIPGVVVFRFDGALYFASVDNFRYRLVKLTGFDPKRRASVDVKTDSGGVDSDNDHEAEEATVADVVKADKARDDDVEKHDSGGLHHVIVDCSGVNYIDSVGATFLTSLVSDYQLAGVQILLAGCKHQVRRMRDRCEFVDKSVMFVSVHDAVLTALADYPETRRRLISEVRSRTNSCEPATATAAQVVSTNASAAAAAGTAQGFGSRRGLPRNRSEPGFFPSSYGVGGGIGSGRVLSVNLRNSVELEV